MNGLIGMNLYVNDELNVEVDYTAGRRNKHKVIDMNTFCDILNKASEMTECKTGVLPDGCIAYRETNTLRRFVALELKARRMNLVYERTGYTDFPIPRLIYGFWLDRYGKVEAVKVTVADMGILKEDTRLYKYPFSNVMDFSMCIGSNTLPPVKYLWQLENMPYYIFTMPDNNDYYKPQNTRLNMEYRTMLEFLKEKEPDFYYSDVLIPNGQTLQDFINQK